MKPGSTGAKITVSYCGPPPFEIGTWYFILHTMWFVRRASDIMAENLDEIRLSCVTLSGEEK